MLIDAIVGEYIADILLQRGLSYMKKKEEDLMSDLNG